MDILISFGKVVRLKRKEKNISQEKLAEKSGLHRTYISEVELGQRNVSLVNIKKICDALEMTLAEMFKQVQEERKSGGS